MQGSRVSDKFDWYCVYYARRDETYELSKDALKQSHCHPKSLQVDMNSSYMTTISVTGSVTYELGPFTIVYHGINDDGDKELEIFRFDGMNVPVEQIYTIAPTATLWNLSLEGVNITLQELTAIPDWTFINFSVFKTSADAKDNIIGANEYTNFTR